MKPLFFKTFRNFLVVNLCAVVPLWMAVFGGMPDEVRVHVRVKGRRPVSLLAYGNTLAGKDCGKRGEGYIRSFSFRDGAELGSLEFLLPGDLDAAAVQRVEVRKWRAFALRKKGKTLVQTDAASNRYAFPDNRFDSLGFASPAWAVLFPGGEFFLLVFSWFFARHHREERAKALLPAVVGAAFALALPLQVVIPLKSYLVNRSAFPFPLSELGIAMAVRFSLSLGLGTAALLLLTRCFGRWILAPVLAFPVCVYLETGILSIGLPELKGDWNFYGNPFRAGWDAAVWAGVFACFLGFHPRLKRHYAGAAAWVSLLTLASLLDVKVEPKADSSKLIVGDFSPIETVVRSTTYAPSGNVLVFVIDSLERGLAHEIMEDPVDGPDLKKRFPGFTEYTNNLGAANSSLLAIANVFTGDFPENANLFDYYVSPYSERSALKDFLEEGHFIAMATEALGYGYCTRPVVSSSGPRRQGCFHVPSTGGNAWTLDWFDRFRCLPFAFKGPYAERIEVSASTSGFSLREWIVYPILRDAEVLSSNRGTFLFVHTEGVHIPVLFDRTGARLPKARKADSVCVEMGIYIMKQLAGLFDAYREKGIYDHSMILVMADHGPHPTERSDDELPPKARPFLWIKPAGATNEFRSSPLPTGHAQLAALLRAASRKTLTEGEIEELIQADERRYRWVRGGVGPEYKDFVLDRNGHVFSRTGSLAQSVGSMAPPELSKPYSLDRSDMGLNELDIVFRNVTFWPVPRMVSETPRMTFFFRAPDPEKQYDLHLSVSCRTRFEWVPPDAAVEFRQTGRQSRWISFPAERETEIVLHGLQPEPDGKIEIECRRGQTLKTAVSFRQLTLEESDPGAEAFGQGEF